MDDPELYLVDVVQFHPGIGTEAVISMAQRQRRYSRAMYRSALWTLQDEGVLTRRNVFGTHQWFYAGTTQ